ncbi:MAG: DUF2585 family protein [Bythopirellula sp.]
MPKLLKRQHWPTLATAALLIATVAQLRHQGRIWFCVCGQPRFWTSEADGPHTSQHLADPYSLTHFLHGLVLFWLVTWLVRRWKWPWQCLLALALEAGWEIFENTQLVIDRYRQTAAIGYTGDSITNSVGDLLACWLGLQVARRISWRQTWVLFFAVEAILLYMIRDSLLLSVIMLVLPLDFIKQWQLG